MKHTGYTPGPWTARQDGPDWLVSTGDPASRRAGLGRIFSIRTGVIPHRDDAALIADAPRVAEENERLRALLVAALDAIQPTRDGKRDGGTFGRLSQVSDNIRTALGREEESK